MIPKILVLTDDQDDGVFIKDVLAEYSVLSATNAKDMEQILVSEEINLVIVDLRCTNRDGLKVLHALQKFSGRRRVPFLYLTGPQMGEAEAEGMKQGAADCLRKPLIREVLLARVRLHLELQKQFADNRELDEHVTLMDAVFVQAPIGIAINLNRLPDSGQNAEVFVNPMYEQITGRKKAELMLMGWEQITHPDDRAEDLEKYEEFVSGDLNGYSLEKRYVRPDGTAVWVHMTLTALVLAESSQRNHICLVQDITRRKEMELALAESERSHSVLLAHLPGMAYRCRPDRNWTMLFVSEGCRELTGYEPESLLYNAKLSYNDIIVPESRERIWQEWQALLPERKIFQMQYEIVTASGERKWVWEMGQGIFEAQGKAEVLEGIILDISAQKKLEDDLLYITEHDPWTGLHNSLFLENLIFRDAKEQRIQGNALVSVNLSALQRVSMTYGFHYVQDLIRKTAQALESLCREDCRLFYASDNQFIFYLDDYRDREKLNQFCVAVKDVIKPLLATENIHAGIGVVEIALEDSVNGEQLLRNLLIASEMAISDGDEDVGVRFYDRAMEVRLVREEDIKNELTLSVINPESKQLILEFQPILDLHTERICGFEALARLHSDRLGRIPPLEFIPIAERTRLIVPLGEKILWQAFAFLKRLDREGHTDISVSVNISVIQLLRQDFAERLLAIIQQAGVEPDRVGLEITESVFVAGYQEINRMLGALQTQGIRIALDDFGTGYSSLAREREMNIDCLKIDKSFIDNLMVLKDDEAITGDIVSMAHKLGHCVVAEGVEHERQREYLLRCGCDRIQGYLISRPVAADAALALLQKEKA